MKASYSTRGPLAPRWPGRSQSLLRSAAGQVDATLGSPPKLRLSVTGQGTSARTAQANVELTVGRLGENNDGERPARVDPAFELGGDRFTATPVGQDSGDARIAPARDQPGAEVEAGVRRALGVLDDHKRDWCAVPGSGPRLGQLANGLVGNRRRWSRRARAIY